MDYICVKRIKLSGREYLPGERIAEGEVLPSRVRTLKAAGRIAEAENLQDAAMEETAAGMKVSVSVPSADGNSRIGLFMDPADVAEVFWIMQLNADDAADAIKEVTDGDILLLIQGTDSRQGVKKAAKAQIGKLEPEAPAAGQE